MSNYRAPAFNPATAKVEEADWLDNHFGHHIYGVAFRDGKVWRTQEVGLEAAAKEIDRMRTLVEQARSCLSAIDQSWLDTFKDGPDGDYNGVDLAEPHKSFWLDAIAFLEASGGRPEAPVIETIIEEDLLRGLEPLISGEPRCDCGHLFEICDAPNCPSCSVTSTECGRPCPVCGGKYGHEFNCTLNQK